jgi:catechol 2,3-dioxygenase-like lactoylglutathione lyase family enzyme
MLPPGCRVRLIRNELQNRVIPNRLGTGQPVACTAGRNAAYYRALDGMTNPTNQAKRPATEPSCAAEGRHAIPIATRGLRHIALRVRNLARARAFYTEVFGMRAVWEPDAQNSDLTTGCDNLALHESGGLPAVFGQEQALDHLGFLVTSRAAVWDAAASLCARGVRVLEEPREHRDGSCSLYCADADGNLIQILFEPTISPLAFR